NRKRCSWLSRVRSSSSMPKRSPRSLVFDRIWATMPKASTMRTEIPMMSQRSEMVPNFTMQGRNGGSRACGQGGHGKRSELHFGIGAGGLLRGQLVGNEIDAVELSIEGAPGRNAGVSSELLHSESLIIQV